MSFADDRNKQNPVTLVEIVERELALGFEPGEDVREERPGLVARAARPARPVRDVARRELPGAVRIDATDRVETEAPFDVLGERRRPGAEPHVAVVTPVLDDLDPVERPGDHRVR